MRNKNANYIAGTREKEREKKREREREFEVVRKLSRDEKGIK